MTDFLMRGTDDRRLYVARMLNFHPGMPETWDKDLIDQLIARAVTAAERSLFDDVRKLLSHV